ncbi:immunity 22 family protein [Psychroserpens sp. SPM9]|uniref:immunity 22 family protein n=1 Tax=Psychroserpens sp. SPM9 TaxID=2975598 RepID=UPI0021A7F31E|nr:immunity 22 family protein [Psychroserpens sp. SPM9]MDG5491997.1 immunity 22 family protein [Psychroserpens sp. SPM9]
MTKKIICVWIGTFKSEDQFYNNYLNFDYTNDDAPESEFAKDSELKYYDEDFMESWWFSKLELHKLTEYKDDLLDSEYFFDELISELKKRDLSNRHSISFLFGEKGEHSTNEMLFEYNGMKTIEKPIEFVFKKEYQL